MANMGLSDLVIVSPRCDVNDPAAVAYATHGESVLSGTRIVADIPEALAGCVRTYATSSKLGLYRRQAAVTVAAAAEEALGLAASGRVAFAFGREDYGFKTQELLHFDRVVTIPADDGYPVMNLAAATAVACYELRQASIAVGGRAALPMAIDSGLAADERKQVLFDKLFDALDGVGFFSGQSRDHLKYALRHLLGRVDMGVNEADIVIGMASQIRWYVDHHPQRVDPPDGAG